MAPSAAAVPDRSEAALAAHRDFPAFLSAALQDNLGRGYGFAPGDTSTTVALGAPLRVYGLDSSLRETNWEGKSIATLVTPVGEWMFPVLVGREYRTIFGVRLIEGHWRGAYLGNPSLARQVRELRIAWGGRKRDRFLLVSCPSPRGFLFALPDERPDNLTPLTVLTLHKNRALVPPINLRELAPASDTLRRLAEYWRSPEQPNSQP
jgi:hypothetical protein